MMSLVLSKSQVFISQNLTSLKKQIFLFYPTLALSMRVRNYFPLFFLFDTIDSSSFEADYCGDCLEVFSFDDGEGGVFTTPEFSAEVSIFDSRLLQQANIVLIFSLQLGFFSSSIVTLFFYFGGSSLLFNDDFSFF